MTSDFELFFVFIIQISAKKEAEEKDACRTVDF